MFNQIGKIALWGFAAFGALKVYEASPLQLRLDQAFSGSRNIGSIQEAIMWEDAGFPTQTRMGSRARRGPRSRT
jgi:hypothetical protein